MKKALSLILALVLCLSLCACGNDTKYDALINYIESNDYDNALTELNNLFNEGATTTTGPIIESKEDLLARAEKIDVYDLHMALQENIVNADAKYKGKTVLLTGYITKLDKEGVNLLCGTWGSENFRVNLAPEDISKVYVDQFIDIVGILTQVDGGLVVDNAYYVNDTYTISGTVVFGYYNFKGIPQVDDLESLYCYGDSDDWQFRLRDTEDGYYYNLNIGFGSNINHKQGERITEINYYGVSLLKGDKITITTKMKNGVGTDGRVLCDVISVEKN